MQHELQASADKRGKVRKIRFDSGFLYAKVKSKEGLPHRNTESVQLSHA